MRELCPPRRKPSEVFFLFLFGFGVPFVSSLAAPVTYSGKVVVASANFNGVAGFTFALIDPEGDVHWRNGADATTTSCRTRKDGMKTKDHRRVRLFVT